MLLNNYLLGTGLGRDRGRSNPYIYYRSGTTLQYYTGDHLVSGETEKDSFPTGTNPPYSYILGFKGVLLTSTTLIDGSGSVVSNLSQGINIEGDLSGSGSITSSLSLITQIAADLAGQGTLTADMVGIVQMAADLAGQGDVTSSLSLISNMIANMNGSGNISGALLLGVANLEADISPFTTLSPESLANAIMNKTIEGSYTFEECMRLLTAVAAGKSTIVDLGGGLATVTFRDINDTQDRVVADMTDSERTNVTLDLDDVI